ncbi:13047_t:CDS:2 [Funneliformis caledonium]|uniref:13047_t:CDS:1 n=1 Tax=Funneliformis caledonium TaxID=1117310 RepID=A0A9N9AHM7_9GLOM|nr:13047_t:CDS:2 [Funneliformis caledonium]
MNFHLKSINSLEMLADPKPFVSYYSKRIIFGKDVRDKVYNSLAKFMVIHRKTTQVFERGLENNSRPNSDPPKDNEVIKKKRNYNVDFLLIHLLHSMRDDETLIQEILRRTKDLKFRMITVQFYQLLQTPSLPASSFKKLPVFLKILTSLFDVSSNLV